MWDEEEEEIKDGRMEKNDKENDEINVEDKNDDKDQNEKDEGKVM